MKPTETNLTELTSPRGYKGLAAFHKYWGKKPVECFAYLIEKLTDEGDIVLDPFLGAGLISREALIRNRRFIGVDINPISIELSTLFMDLPSHEDYGSAITSLEKAVKPKIGRSYKLSDGNIASHYLWEGQSLKSVWRVNSGPIYRQEFKPERHDIELFRKYEDHKSQYIRQLNFFQNSRINTTPSLSLNDLFTGRALFNIDLLLKHINKQPISVKRSLLLTLTSASGQMSQMVFAITHRGKKTGNSSSKIEVGSWVIGYWRPTLHFEINVWKCFSNRAKKLLKALKNLNPPFSFPVSSDPKHLINLKTKACLMNNDSRIALKKIPDSSVSLILTDPPHSDRIPYLELSEIWNAILAQDISFEGEIVVSNASERNKNKEIYNKEMTEFFFQAIRVLKEGGIIAIIFNARDDKSWTYLKNIENESGMLIYKGCFPMPYSAGSVVQDNRLGALKKDYVLIYQKIFRSPELTARCEPISMVPGWLTSFPGD